MENKICKNCNIEKTINEFPKTGRLCKICFNEYMSLRRPKKEKIVKTEKVCKNCNIEKSINEFKEKSKLCLMCHDDWRKEYDKNYQWKQNPLITKKICKNCNIEKSINEFPKKSNLCLICFKEKKNEYQKLRYKKLRRPKKEKIVKTEKVCKNCNIEKSINEFPKKGKLCLICLNEYIKLRRPKKEKIVKTEKVCKNCNKKKSINEFKEKSKLCLICFKEYYKVWNKNYIKNKLLTDENYKTQKIIRNLIYTAINNYGYKKNSKTENILGCTLQEFKIYIQSLFEEWMTWDNHGKYTGNYNETWQIDHIIPIYEANTYEEIIKLNHYTNLRPLCSKKNLEKSNMIVEIK